jgi:hypothetical protein
MARANFSKDHLPWLGPIGVIFVGTGAIFGLLGSYGIGVGVLAGVLMFGIFVGLRLAVAAGQRDVDDARAHGPARLSAFPGTGKPLNATYNAIKSGEIPSFRFGDSIRIPTSWMKQKLGLTEAA